MPLMQNGTHHEGARVPRSALAPDGAAGTLSVGRSWFYEQVMPELRVIRRGRVPPIPVSEPSDGSISTRHNSSGKPRDWSDVGRPDPRASANVAKY